MEGRVALQHRKQETNYVRQSRRAQRSRCHRTSRLWTFGFAHTDIQKFSFRLNKPCFGITEHGARLITSSQHEPVLNLCTVLHCVPPDAEWKYFCVQRVLQRSSTWRQQQEKHLIQRLKTVGVNWSWLGRKGGTYLNNLQQLYTDCTICFTTFLRQTDLRFQPIKLQTRSSLVRMAIWGMSAHRKHKHSCSLTVTRQSARRYRKCHTEKTMCSVAQAVFMVWWSVSRSWRHRSLPATHFLTFVVKLFDSDLASSWPVYTSCHVRHFGRSW